MPNLCIYHSSDTKTMSSQDRDQLLQRAVEDLLLPVARLCVQRGLPFAQAEELFKRAFVDAARRARREQGAPGARDVSQVAVATGLHRREVARIGQAQPRAVQRPAPATQLVTRWLSDPALRHGNGRIRRLPRQGEAPSFEALAGEITRHVHPRSLLDELLRRGLVKLRDDDTVELLTDHITPDGDEARLLGFLAANAGDHLNASVDNVIHGDRRHFEQAVFTDSMSPEGLAKARALVQAQWQLLLQNLVPALQEAIQEDRLAGREQRHRIRIGLYSYHERKPDDDDETQL